MIPTTRETTTLSTKRPLRLTLSTCTYHHSPFIHIYVMLVGLLIFLCPDAQTVSGARISRQRSVVGYPTRLSSILGRFDSHSPPPTAATASQQRRATLPSPSLLQMDAQSSYPEENLLSDDIYRELEVEDDKGQEPSWEHLPTLHSDNKNQGQHERAGEMRFRQVSSSSPTSNSNSNAMSPASGSYSFKDYPTSLLELFATDKDTPPTADANAAAPPKADGGPEAGVKADELGNLKTLAVPNAQGLGYVTSFDPHLTSSMLPDDPLKAMGISTNGPTLPPVLGRPDNLPSIDDGLPKAVVPNPWSVANHAYNPTASNVAGLQGGATAHGQGGANQGVHFPSSSDIQLRMTMEAGRDQALRNMKQRSPRLELLQRAYESAETSMQHTRMQLNLILQAQEAKNAKQLSVQQRQVSAVKSQLDALTAAQKKDATTVNMYNSQLRKSSYQEQLEYEKNQLNALESAKKRIQTTINETSTKLNQTDKILGVNQDAAGTAASKPVVSGE